MNVQIFEVWNGWLCRKLYLAQIWQFINAKNIRMLRHFFLEPVSQTKKLIPGLVLLSVQSTLPIIPHNFVNSADDSSWLGLWQSSLVKVIQEMFSIYSFQLIFMEKSGLYLSLMPIQSNVCLCFDPVWSTTLSLFCTETAWPMMSRVFGICLLFLNISMKAGMFSSDSLDIWGD